MPATIGPRIRGTSWKSPAVSLFSRALRGSSIAAILQVMKTVVTITGRGVMTLPAKLRAALGIKADDQLIAETIKEWIRSLSTQS